MIIAHFTLPLTTRLHVQEFRDVLLKCMMFEYLREYVNLLQHLSLRDLFRERNKKNETLM
jgi:hypothetical protein